MHSELDGGLSARCESLERQLRIQEEQFRGVFENSSIGMAIVSLRGQWIKVNNSLLRMLGYDRERLYKLRFQDITHPDDLDQDLERLEALVAGKVDGYQLEKRYFNSAGKIVWGRLSVSIVRDADGNPLHFVSQIVDITDDKRLTHLRLTDMDKKINAIAYELHENIAQSLASIKLFLASSRAAKQYGGADLQTVDKKLSTLISDIQHLTDRIVPSTFMHESLQSLINGLVMRSAALHGISIDVYIDEFAKKLLFPSTYAIFRIIETQIESAAVRNATTASIRLEYNDTLTLEFSDNGNAEGSTKGSKIDLLISNIKTRVEMLDGVIRTPTGVDKPNSYNIEIRLEKAL